MINNAKRNSSIELLRIIAEIGVVILHLNNANVGGGFKFVVYDSINMYLMYFLESVFICAVDLFIIISAYYLSTTNSRRLSKIIELLVLVIEFSIISYTISIVFFNHNFELTRLLIFLFPANYFVIIYSALYLVSPYINILMDKLTKKQAQVFVLISFSIFSIWSFCSDCLTKIGISESLSPVSMYGSQDGYTFVNFCLLYIIGAYIGKHKCYINKTKLFIAMIINFVFIFFFSTISNVAWQYNNPLVILSAIFVFLFFNSFDYKNSIINTLSKASFTCFLIHGDFLQKLRVITDTLANQNALIVFCYYVFVSVTIYLISIFVHLINNLTITKAVRKIFKRVDDYDIYKLKQDFK